MTARHYSNTAVTNSYTTSLNNTDVTTTASVNTTPSGWPAVPFTAIIDADTASEEVVLVTNIVGTSVTATRGYDGTSKKTHSSGATINPGVAGIDFTESNDHVNATTNIHGLGGGAALVGTTTSQTLTNKTISGPAISGGTISGTAIDAATLTSPTIASNQWGGANHDHTDSSHGGQLQVANLLGNFVGNTQLGLTYPTRAAYQGSNLTSTSNSYANQSSPSITFTAPPSGNVFMMWTAPVQTASTIIAAFLAPTCSSGTSNDNVALGPDDRNAVSGTVGTTVFTPFTGMHCFGGLSAGQQYTARIAIRSGTNGQQITVGVPFSLALFPLA